MPGEGRRRAGSGLAGLLTTGGVKPLLRYRSGGLTPPVTLAPACPGPALDSEGRFLAAPQAPGGTQLDLGWPPERSSGASPALSFQPALSLISKLA